MYAASPGAGEEAVYEAHRRLLGLAGVAIAPPAPPVEHLGLPLSLFPAVALSPRFALTVDQLMSNVPGGAAVSVSATSTLWLDGHVTLHSLALDGALGSAPRRARASTCATARWPTAGGRPAGGRSPRTRPTSLRFEDTQ